MSVRPPSAGAVLAPPARRRLRTGPPLSPGPPDRGGDGGDDRGGAPVPPGGSPAKAPLLGLVLALAGIGTLFSIFLAAWILLRRLEPDAARASALVPPRMLWISTCVLLASSVALERARRSLRADHSLRAGRSAARWLLASLFLGLAFLLAQALLWWHFLSAGIFPSSGAYGATFFALTGLHAAHVVFGIAWLARASIRAVRLGPACGPLELLAIYWHFMGCLWLALFAALYFVR